MCLPFITRSQTHLGHTPQTIWGLYPFGTNSRSEARLVESGEKTHYIRKIRKERDVKKANRGQQRVYCITLCKANAPWGWDLDFQSSGILAKNHSQAGPLPPWVLTATSQPWPAADGTKNNIRQRKGSNYDCLEIGIRILNYYQPDSKINTQSQPEIGQSLPGLGRVAREMEQSDRLHHNEWVHFKGLTVCYLN